LLPGLLRAGLADVADLSGDRAYERIQQALAELNRRVRAESERRTGHPGNLGATLDLVLVRAGMAVVVHLGDSRVYLCRAGRRTPLTHDAAYVQKLLDEGLLTPAEAAACPGNGGPTRYVGMPGQPQADVCYLNLHPGDRLLLCSDGLTGELSEDRILAVLS